MQIIRLFITQPWEKEAPSPGYIKSFLPSCFFCSLARKKHRNDKLSSHLIIVRLVHQGSVSAIIISQDPEMLRIINSHYAVECFQLQVLSTAPTI